MRRNIGPLPMHWKIRLKSISLERQRPLNSFIIIIIKWSGDGEKSLHGIHDCKVGCECSLIAK